MTDRSKLEYEIKHSSDGQYYVSIRAAGNREVLAVSERYKRKRAALRMIQLIREGAADGVVDDQTTDE